MPPLKTGLQVASRSWMNALGAREAPGLLDATPAEPPRLVPRGVVVGTCAREGAGPPPAPSPPALLTRREHHACSIDSPWPEPR